MSRLPEGVEDAHCCDFDAEALLRRDSHVLLDPLSLRALHRELGSRGDARLATVSLLRMGFLHGMRDAFRALAAGPAERWRPPLAIRCRGVPARGAVEVRGDWPESPEAAARARAAGPANAGSCAFSAGYTSGWLSAMLDADLLALEESCGGSRGGGCRFVAREASLWREEDLRGVPADAIPFDAFRALVLAHEACRDPGRLSLPELPGIDRDAACVHIWGPVMVIPFSGPDDGMRALELIGSDPEAAEVSVVIVHLGHALIDEAFGALALEQIVQAAEAWGAETLFAEPSPLCERVLAELSHPPLLILKDLEQAVVTGFQIADSQRRIC